MKRNQKAYLGIVKEHTGVSVVRPMCVHHVDSDPSNNERSNLVVCPNQSYHKMLHARQRVQDIGGDPNVDKWCTYHKCLHHIEEFSYQNGSYDGRYNSCRSGVNEYRRDRKYGKWGWKRSMQQQYRRCNNDRICWL